MAGIARQKTECKRTNPGGDCVTFVAAWVVDRDVGDDTSNTGRVSKVAWECPCNTIEDQSMVYERRPVKNRARHALCVQD